MVQIKNSETYVSNGQVVPIMHQHVLKCLKSSKQFNEGETVSCFISKYQNDRFAVWDASWLHHNKYEVFSKDELHETFEES